MNNNFRVKDYYFPSVNNLTAMEIGNSMSENFNEFLPYSFRHLKYFRANNGHRDFLHEFRISEYEQETRYFDINAIQRTHHSNAKHVRK